MPQPFIPIKAEEITDNPFTLLDKEWMLVTSGSMDGFNTMTASWGGFGILWHKPVVFCFIRPSRYTYEFLEKNNSFSLSFFPEKFRKALAICGSKSGRDGDKIKAAGLTPVSSTEKTIYFEEARLVLVCHKLYSEDLKSQRFLCADIFSHYPEQDIHRMYIGEIISGLKRE